MFDDNQKNEIHNEIIDIFKARKCSPFEVGQILSMLLINFAKICAWDEERFAFLVEGLRSIYKKMLEENK